MINTFARLVRSTLPASRARKLRTRLGRDLRGQLYTSRRNRAHLQYDNLRSRYAAQGKTKLRLSLIRRLRAQRLRRKVPSRVLRRRRLRPLALRVTRLQRVNLRVKRVVQRQHGLVDLRSASRGAKL